MINSYLQKNQEYNKKSNKVISKVSSLDFKLLKKEIILSDLIHFLDVELFKKNNINWILCGGTNLSKCHNLINRLSEDLDILIIEETNTQAKKIIPIIFEKICELEEENFFIDKDSNESCNDKNINEKNFININLKIKVDEQPINYSLEILSVASSFHSYTKKELLSIYDVLFPLEDNKKIFVNSLNPEVTVAEKIIKIHKLLTNVNNKNDLNKRDLRHFYDIYRWFKKRKDDNEIINLKNIYEQILNSRNADKKHFKTTNILYNNLFIKNLSSIEKDLKTFLKTEVYGENNFSKNVLNSIEEIKKILINLKNIKN